MSAPRLRVDLVGALGDLPERAPGPSAFARAAAPVPRLGVPLGALPYGATLARLMREAERAESERA